MKTPEEFFGEVTAPQAKYEVYVAQDFNTGDYLLKFRLINWRGFWAAVAAGVKAHNNGSYHTYLSDSGPRGQLVFRVHEATPEEAAEQEENARDIKGGH